MLWIKAFHIIFVASWFAGLFYLPRIFVNLAEETQPAALERLLGMARRLFKFMTILAVPAIGLGLWLWQGYGIGNDGSGWMHAKMSLVFVTAGYHHLCLIMLREFEAKRNTRSGRFYRWFNEVPVVLMTGMVLLVVLKPF